MSGAMAGGVDEYNGGEYLHYTMNANMWVQLAELLIDSGYLQCCEPDLQAMARRTSPRASIPPWPAFPIRTTRCT